MSSPIFRSTVAAIMNSGTFRTVIFAVSVTLALSLTALAQQDTGPIERNAGQASQPAGVTSGPGNPASTMNAASPGGSDTVSTTPKGASANTPPEAAPANTPTTTPGTDASIPTTDTATPKTDHSAPTTDSSTPQTDEPRTVINSGSADPNANNPFLEPPPLPKTKPTLIGGTAARVDHVRNLLTIQPFGGGQKIKVFIDERSHIYRDGGETTVLGIRKGDRVYADTMLRRARVRQKCARGNSNRRCRSAWPGHGRESREGNSYGSR